MNFAENSENFCDKAVFSPFPGGTREGKKFFSGAVCLFDSGVGGLSVLFKCREILPSRKFIYYGDNVRAPYGNLPPEAICRYVSEAAEELAGYFPPALVLACNTAEACCGESLRKKYPFPVLGACPPVLAAGKNGGDGLVLVTRATYESRAFASLLRQAEMRFPAARFYPYPCDSLAGKIEDTLASAPDAFYTAELPAQKFSFVILGCTHYAHVREAIARRYGCPVYDGAEELARRLAVTLAAGKTEAGSRSSAEDSFPAENENGVDFSAGKGKEQNLRPCVTTSVPAAQNSADFSAETISSDGKVLFLGSGREKNRTFYEHSFVRNLS